MQDTEKNILKKYFGYDEFRKGQKEVIESILGGKDTLAIMPTGAGKSLCYQVPAMAMDGITIVISPLISLMKDQVDSLDSVGIKSTYINSTLSNLEIGERLFDARDGQYKLIYVAPERLDSREFFNFLNEIEISLIAIDEAHCVSQWGHDFRPSYTRVSGVINGLQKRPVVAAFTATATQEVKEDIQKLLYLESPNTFVTGFDRENLTFSVIRGEDKYGFIEGFLKDKEGETGIIYTSTRKEAENLNSKLALAGYKTGLYHGGLSESDRTKAQDDFSYDNIDVIVATNAFGMGIDKSNVRYVIHNNMPKNMESYYQEAGRAGRDGEDSECILLFNPKDIQTQKFFIEETVRNESRKSHEYKRLQDMVDYCHTSVCLRKYILEYFGEEEVSDSCENCSICNDDRENQDITELAQKVFSCIYRMQERFGVIMVAETLKGSKNRKLLNFGLDKLSTYGIVKGYTTKELQDIINKLTADGFLFLTEGQYPVVKLTPRAIGVLKGKEEVFMKVEKAKTVKVGKDNELFNILRELRKEIAVENGIPPYIVFSDASIREMSEYLPLEKRSMLSIKGVGESKFEKYGKRFVSAIKRYVDEKGVAVDSKQEASDGQRTDKVKSHVLSLELYNEGKDIDEIASIRGITRLTAENHLFKCAVEGMDIDLSKFIPDEYRDQIFEAIESVGAQQLKPIKEALPEEVTYTAIKAALAEYSK